MVIEYRDYQIHIEYQQNIQNIHDSFDRIEEFLDLLESSDEFDPK